MFGKWEKRCKELESKVEDLEWKRDVQEYRIDFLKSENDKLNDAMQEIKKKGREDLQIPINKGLFNFMGKVLEVHPTSDISIDTFYPEVISLALSVRSESIPDLNLSKEEKED